MAQTARMAIHEMYPYLRMRGAAEAAAFYIRVFDAKEKFRLVEPSGRVGHLELELGPGVLMLSDEYPEMNIVGPEARGGTTVSLHLHVDDCDAVMARAIEAGAVQVRPATDQFYGERSGTVRDPWGHEWLIGHSLEDITPEEMQRRYDALFA